MTDQETTNQTDPTDQTTQESKRKAAEGFLGLVYYLSEKSQIVAVRSLMAGEDLGLIIQGTIEVGLEIGLALSKVHPELVDEVRRLQLEQMARSNPEILGDFLKAREGYAYAVEKATEVTDQEEKAEPTKIRLSDAAFIGSGDKNVH